MRRFLLLATLAVGFSACDDGSNDQGRLTFDRAVSKWADNGPASYSFTMVQVCVCQGPVNEPIRVTVENGVVTSRLVIALDTQLEAQYNARFPAVPGLFDIIEEALDSNVPAMQASYDGVIGHPLEIQINYNLATSNDDLQIIITDFTAGT